MKNKYTRFIAIFMLLFISQGLYIQGQITNLEGIDEFDGDKPTGGIQLPKKCDCGGAEIGDFKFYFNGGNIIETTLENDRIRRRLYEAELDRWFNRQKNEIIKPAIETKYGKKFKNFEEAKKALLINSESNVNTNFSKAFNKLKSKRNTTSGDRSKDLGELKALALREAEIKGNNTNNSPYGFLKIGDTFLKDIKSLNDINPKRINLIKGFDAKQGLYDYNKQIYDKINSKEFRKELNDEIYRIKNAYYRQFGKFDRLNFLSYLINIEKINAIPLITFPSELFGVRDNVEKSIVIKDAKFIEDLAHKNRDVTKTVFHPKYWRDILRFEYAKQFPYNFDAFAYQRDLSTLTIRAKNEAGKRKQAEIDRLLNAVDEFKLKTTSLINELGITDSNQKNALLENTDRAKELIDIANQFRVNNTINPEVKNYLQGQAELDGFTKHLDRNWKAKKGKIHDRDSQSYVGVFSDGVRSYYLMKNGDVVFSSPQRLKLGKDHELVTIFRSDSEGYWYIKQKGESEWANYLLKDPKSLKDELALLFQLGVIEGGKLIGRYILPIEDFKIIIDGKNFDGEQVARWKAAGGIILAIVPGGVLVKGGTKVVKAVTKIASHIPFWTVTVKAGGRIYTKIVYAIAEPTLEIFNRYGNGLKEAVDNALRRGEITGEIIEETAEILPDLYKNKKFTWAQVKALFARGNKFNKKAVTNNWYPYHEIHLANGKRLDSYDDILKEIISRKATDLSKIKFSTFEKYLKELVSKYKVGTKIRSNKYLKQLDGKLLEGTYILEIPNSNKSFHDIQRYIDYAWDNYKIKIRFRPE